MNFEPVFVSVVWVKVIFDIDIWLPPFDFVYDIWLAFVVDKPRSVPLFRDECDPNRMIIKWV